MNEATVTEATAAEAAAAEAAAAETMGTNKKRRPIRSQVQRLVLMIAVAALALAGILAVLSMRRIQSISQEYLLDRMEHNLSSTVQSKAELADSELGKYAGYVDAFAEYLHQLYVSPKEQMKRTVLPPDRDKGGIYTLQRCLANEDMRYESIRAELELLGNVEDIFHPVMVEEDGLITSIYLETESGFMIAYDQNADISAAEDNGEVYADFRDADWYKLALHSDKVVFTDVYMDSFGRGLTITCCAPFTDDSGKPAGVVCMDILISDLYDRVVEIDLGEGAYAFLADSKGSAIAPEAAISSIQEDPDMDASIRSQILRRENSVRMSQSGVYYAFCPVPSVDWMLCIHMPQELIVAPVKAMNANVITAILIYLAVVLLILAMVMAAARRFSTTLSDPLIALDSDVKTISGGNLDYRATVRNNDEIGDLAVSFNEMAGSLKKYIADLTSVTAEKERIGAELNVATQIQADMLPRIFPAFPERTEFDLYASMSPAKEVGGDFYDFFLVDDNHLGLVMADVSGKGVPAALFMVIAKTLIKNRAQLGESPAEILTHVNEQLCEGNEAELFVTVWLAVIEISSGKGLEANAGHEHPVIRRADGTYELVIYRHSPAVATMEGIRFREHAFELNPGDSLFVYTDGVPEATNAQNEMFGTDRMLEALNQDPDASPEQILKNVRAAVDGFVKDAEQFDDITMLGMKYFG